MASRLVRTNAVTVSDVLDGHKLLEVDCVDRVYLTLSVSSLVVGGQVVSFLTAHEHNPIPSPALLERRGLAFRRAVTAFAEANHIPVLSFAGKREPVIDRDDKAPVEEPIAALARGLGDKQQAWQAAPCRKSAGLDGAQCGQTVPGDPSVWPSVRAGPPVRRAAHHSVKLPSGRRHTGLCQSASDAAGLAALATAFSSISTQSPGPSGRCE
jgi:hypothetical protein